MPPSLCVFQRMDLGECLKVHDLALRADYEIASKDQDFFFELDVRILSQWQRESEICIPG